MINKIKNIKLRGFTLIETLVAILILSTAIAGPLTIASKGLNAALVAKDQVIAYYLAQDGLEYIRFARDTNRLQGGDWLTGAGGGVGIVDLTSCTLANGCQVDATGNTAPTACITPTCAVLKYNNSTKRFNYSSVSGSTNVATIFFRKITLTRVTDTEYKLVVSVTWSDLAGITHQPTTLQENLFNWQ